VTARIIGGLFISCALAAAAVAQDVAPSLPPLEQCQAESLELRAALVEFQERAVRAEAALARVELARMREEFGAKSCPGAAFNWESKTCGATPAK
jgi:hypothetical protein